MIGILLVTHGQIGTALIDAAEFIVGSRPEAVTAVSINLNEDAEKLREKIAKGIETVYHPRGVLILTDMFGGTPSNLSYSFLEEGRLEVLTGANLPILIKAIDTRKDMDLSEMAKTLENYGKKSIAMASGIIKGNKRG
ncbi:MAG: PTS fructose transporter subunit IIA [Thermodesulfobacteriota bacterium]|nr:PTS fructose transporter subunit IIA [Thermodesulfobacteriota bacterium]